jgi:hypothetical protein
MVERCGDVVSPNVHDKQIEVRRCFSASIPPSLRSCMHRLVDRTTRFKVTFFQIEVYIFTWITRFTE